MLYVHSSEVTKPRYSGAGTIRYAGSAAARRKFLRFFKKGFVDPTYLAWERDYKWLAHQRWAEALHRSEMERLLGRGEHQEIARRAVQIESRTNLLFSFEKMALRDAVRTQVGARRFATGLHAFLHAQDTPASRFEAWCETIASLPRRQTRVLTWPIATVFGFLASPARHIFLKPVVTRTAADQYRFPFTYRSRPNWETYAELLNFARVIRADLADLHPRDLIDIQSFIWVQGSSEYD
jgi:hypothetical protein